MKGFFYQKLFQLLEYLEAVGEAIKLSISIMSPRFDPLTLDVKL